MVKRFVSDSSMPLNSYTMTKRFPLFPTWFSETIRRERFHGCQLGNKFLTEGNVSKLINHPGAHAGNDTDQGNFFRFVCYPAVDQTDKVSPILMDTLRKATNDRKKIHPFFLSPKKNFFYIKIFVLILIN